MNHFKRLFNKSKCAVIGMIHVGSLPGTPRYQGTIEEIVSKACKEADIYLKHNVDGILVENMHDVPYVQSKHFGPEIVASLTRVCNEVRNIVPKSIPCGIQVLACGNKEALAIANATGFNFIRVEGYVFSHIADEGFTDAQAGILLWYRKQIGAEHILAFADVKKKHSSHSITNDISLIDTVKAAEFFLADGVILTGTATGDPTPPEDLVNVKNSSKLPVLIGSGVNTSNLEKYLSADGLIIGTHFKKDEKWFNELDEDTISNFMKTKCQLEQNFI